MNGHRVQSGVPGRIAEVDQSSRQDLDWERRSYDVDNIPPGQEAWEVWPNDLLYGNVHGRLFFSHRIEIQMLAQLRRALWTSRTWGQFAILPPAYYRNDPIDLLRGIKAQGFPGFRDDLRVHDPGMSTQEAMRRYRQLEVGQRLPLSDDPFDRGAIPRFPGQTWPPFPPEYTDDWMPDAIFSAFGVVVGPPDDPLYVYFRPEQEATIVVRLEESGFPCVRNDALVGEALGFG